MMVSMNMEGTVMADGTSTTNPEDGDIDSMTIGGDLTGSVLAMGSGTIGMFNVGGSVGTDGSVAAEEITTMMVSMNMEGTVTADGRPTATSEDGDIDMLEIGGDLTGSVTAIGSGTITFVVVGGSLTDTGLVNAEEIINMSVDGATSGSIMADDIGTVSAGGAISSFPLLSIQRSRGAADCGRVAIGGSFHFSGRLL